jgi:hypothetical protein
MKNLIISAFVIFFTLFYFTYAAKERNILWNQYQNKTKSLDDINGWRTKLKQEVEANLKKIPESIKQELIKKADNESQSSWPSLLVTDFLEFAVNGNRDHFEGLKANRRKKLLNLIIGEMLTEKGKYMNHIVDGVWLILEESTWIWPAHLGVQKAGKGLPDPTEVIIDLGAGEGSAFMAWIKFLLGMSS